MKRLKKIQYLSLKALAVCLLKLRNFKPEDYAVFHPGGSLGKKLMTTVADIMDSGDKVPVVEQGIQLRDAITVLQDKHYGVAAVVIAAIGVAGAPMVPMEVPHPLRASSAMNRRQPVTIVKNGRVKGPVIALTLLAIGIVRAAVFAVIRAGIEIDAERYALRCVALVPVPLGQLIRTLVHLHQRVRP